MISTNFSLSRSKAHDLGTDSSVLSHHTGPQTTSYLAIFKRKKKLINLSNYANTSPPGNTTHDERDKECSADKCYEYDDKYA